jgi:hypothetical protein
MVYMCINMVDSVLYKCIELATFYHLRTFNNTSALVVPFNLSTAAISYGPPYSAASSLCLSTAAISYSPPYSAASS